MALRLLPRLTRNRSPLQNDYLVDRVPGLKPWAVLLRHFMAENCTMNSQGERSSLAGILRDSALELLLTFLMLFGVVSIVRWVIGPSPISQMIPEIHAELLIVGVAVAILIIAQLLGSILGGVAARLFWGPVVAQAPVAYAALQPGPGWSTLSLFAAETVSMGIIVLLVGICLTVARLAPFVPWIVGGAIGIAIAVLGTSTGGSVNPARQFGPATLSGQTNFLCVYLLAPMVGALLAAWVRQIVQRHRYVLTHRLCGTQPDGGPLSH